MSNRKQFEVLVTPSAGNGSAFTEIVTALNPPQAVKIVESRFPSDWKVWSAAREV